MKIFIVDDEAPARERLRTLLGDLAPLYPHVVVGEAASGQAALGQSLRGGGRSHLSCHERGRLLLVPVSEVLYLRADLKYVMARTLEREYLLDDSLAQLEQEFPDRFLRLHRAVLVAREALAGFEKASGDDVEAYGWALLRGLPEKLPISRRQWAAAKAAGAAGNA